MSAYSEMWSKVKELTPRQQAAWLETISPPRGNSINFRGVQVIDIDLAEALQYMVDEHSQESH